MLFLILRNGKFVLINVAVITALSLAIALLLPKEYYSYATLRLSSDQSFGVGSILGNLPNLPFLDELGFNSSQAKLDTYISILESRTILDSMVYKFNLQDRYEKKYRFLAREEFLDKSDREGDMLTDILTVGIYDEDPVLAKEMVEYYVSLLDREVQRLFNENARNNRIFAEQRLLETRGELKAAEDSLAEFQRIQGIFEPQEQVLLALKVASDLEARLMEEEIKLRVAKKMLSSESAEVRSLELRIAEIQSKINSLKRNESANNHVGDESFLVRFENVPDLALQYLRLYRNVQIKQRILEFLVPVYEKAKLDEAKNIPSLLVIDEPQVAEYKARPKRAYIVIGGFLFSLIFCISIIMFRDYVGRTYANANPELQAKMKYIASRLPSKRKDNDV